MEKIIGELKSMDGFIGVHPLTNYQTGQLITILVFDSYNNAIGGRNILKFYGNDVGTYIMEGELSDDMQTITINKPAERS